MRHYIYHKKGNGQNFCTDRKLSHNLHRGLFPLTPALTTSMHVVLKAFNSCLCLLENVKITSSVFLWLNWMHVIMFCTNGEG